MHNTSDPITKYNFLNNYVANHNLETTLTTIHQDTASPLSLIKKKGTIDTSQSIWQVVCDFSRGVGEVAVAVVYW